ncbi:cytochrome c oxidase subunit II [Chthonobacter rhizosphaerae]|uniref:cytochrome c oxidase subunit II n=1 Tax=Chthonobacter rhizosphaerae TaxID=2735553 RepID=UPI0031B60CCA
MTPLLSATQTAARRTLPLALCLAAAGCSGPQSALDPAGREAETVAHLFFVMTIGGAVIWLAVIALAVYAGGFKQRTLSEETGQRLILWGGAVVPTLILAALLAYALWLMPDLRPWTREAMAEGGVKGHVTAEQYWWRVRMEGPGGPVESANELIVPVGQRVDLTLTSPDVIHSFWIPALAGKIDMIPGRTNRITLRADRPGVYRGVCAEFCGESHALMAFTVRAVPPQEHAALAAAEARPAAVTSGEGLRLFLEKGCAACHAIRGTEARGGVGPDLTHVGSRPTIAAATLPNDQASRERFLRNPDAVKPGVRMPGYDMLPPAEIETLARFLGDLK